METIIMAAVLILGIVQSIRVIKLKNRIHNVEKAFKQACTCIYELKKETRNE